MAVAWRVVGDAAEAVVRRLDHRVLQTRHHDWKPWLPTENGFRELQPIDLLYGNDHHLNPLKTDGCESSIGLLSDTIFCMIIK